MLRRFGVPTLYLLVVFLCGTALGSLGYRYYSDVHVSANEPPRPSPEKWKKHHLEEMKSRLHLTDDQTSRLSAVLDETRGQYHDLMEKQRPDMERIQAEQYAKVKALLTPEQVPEYERLHAEREKQRRAMDVKKF